MRPQDPGERPHDQPGAPYTSAECVLWWLVASSCWGAARGAARRSAALSGLRSWRSGMCCFMDRQHKRPRSTARLSLQGIRGCCTLHTRPYMRAGCPAGWLASYTPRRPPSPRRSRPRAAQQRACLGRAEDSQCLTHTTLHSPPGSSHHTPNDAGGPVGLRRSGTARHEAAARLQAAVLVPMHMGVRGGRSSGQGYEARCADPRGGRMPSAGGAPQCTGLKRI